MSTSTSSSPRGHVRLSSPERNDLSTLETWSSFLKGRNIIVGIEGFLSFKERYRLTERTNTNRMQSSTLVRSRSCCLLFSEQPQDVLSPPEHRVDLRGMCSAPPEHNPKTVAKSESTRTGNHRTRRVPILTAWFTRATAKEEGDRLEEEGKDEPPEWAKK
jgi:hypothetical protein